MAHEFSSGVFLNGESAWHGLGTVLPGTLPARQAFNVARADWPVLALPIFDENGIPQDGYNRIIRADNRKLLSVQPDSYTIVQNERLIQIAESISDHADMSAVCVLREGKRVSFTAQIKDCAGEVVKGDPIRQYIVGATSHDGTIAFSVLFSPIRVVCQNTLSQALGLAEHGAANKSIKVRHTKNANSLIDCLPKLIDCQRQQFKGGIRELEAMAAKDCNFDQFKCYVASVFSDQLTGTVNAIRGQSSSARPRILEDLPQYNRLKSLYLGGAIGSDIAGVRGTWWGAYNAVTQWISHESSKAKDPTEAARQRLESLYWGKNADLTAKAHNLALAATKA